MDDLLGKLVAENAEIIRLPEFYSRPIYCCLNSIATHNSGIDM